VNVSRSASVVRQAGPTVEFVNCVRAFETEFDYVYRALKRHGVNPADAEDLAQEVFLVMWRRWADYDSARPLRPWLAGIAFKVAHDYRRRSGREVPGGLVDAEDQAPGAEEHLASARARTLVLRALGSLPEKQRTIIVMHDLDGASMREIADILSVPLFTAYSRLRSARQAFAKSVRRLHTLAMATAGLDRLPSPHMLLRAERVPPPAPPPTRRRAVSRVRALALAALPPQDPKRGPPSAPITRALPLAVGAAALAAIALLAVTLQPSSSTRHEKGDRPGASPGRMASVLPARRAPAPQVAASLARGVIGYWRFDETGATVAHDRSGQGNDCTLRTRAAAASYWTDGVNGGALNLDGRGWLACTRVDSWAALSSEITVAGWVKRPAGHPGLRALVSRQQGDDSADYFMLGFSGDLLVFASNVWNVRVRAVVPRYDRWVHVAATRSADGVAVLYVDGVEATRVARAPGRSIAGGPNSLLIGAGLNVPDPDAPTELLEGAMDDLLIYKRALAAEEIAALAAGAEPKI
jgi:RNA polymerase sigma factor (sigma-70 family)